MIVERVLTFFFLFKNQALLPGHIWGHLVSLIYSVNNMEIVKHESKK